MHILILPSEEFIPAHTPFAGIFQYHQALILKEGGYKVGVISIRQTYSILMIIKSIGYKLLNKRISNPTSEKSIKGLVELLYKKIFKVDEFINTYVKDGINVYEIDGFYYMPPKENKNHFGWKKAGLKAFEVYKQKEGMPDIIHAHNAVYAGMLANSIFKRYSIPYVLTEHSTAFAQGQIKGKKLYNRIRESYLNSKGTYAVSNPFCKLLNEKFKFTHFKCLYNVLDPYLEEQDNKITCSESGFIFLNIALLHPKKDHELLINAFNDVIKKYPGIKLLIGGKGAMGAVLKKQVGCLNLQNDVKFLGDLDRSQVAHFLSKCNCFVLSSKYETFGVVVIEAMLFGKPVIVTRSGGPEDFVDESMGLVINTGSRKELANAMISMIENAGSYDGEKIKKETITMFGRDTFFEQVSRIYSEVLETSEKRSVLSYDSNY